MIKENASPEYVRMMNTKWNSSNYYEECMIAYKSQFIAPTEQKISNDFRNKNISKVMGAYKLFLANKVSYMKEPYKAKDSAKPDGIKTVKTFVPKALKVYDVPTPEYPYKPMIPTVWKLSKVSEEEFNKNECDLLHYNALKKDMFDKYEQVQTVKRKINELECVERFKNIERQLKEYKRELEDSKKRLELHKKLENDQEVGLYKFSKNERHIKKVSDKATYQKKLQSSLSELIKYSEKSLEVAEYKMQQNKDYRELSDKLTSEKLSYSLALRKVTDCRKKFFKYKVAPKSALWEHGKKVNGLHWFPITNIRYMKSYDKVTFNYETLELKLH